MNGKARAKNRGNEDRPIKLDGFASRVAREEDVCLALRDVIYIQNLFSMVAKRLGRDGGETIETKEGGDEEDGGEEG